MCPFCQSCLHLSVFEVSDPMPSWRNGNSFRYMLYLAYVHGKITQKRFVFVDDTVALLKLKWSKEAIIWTGLAQYWLQNYSG